MNIDDNTDDSMSIMSVDSTMSVNLIQRMINGKIHMLIMKSHQSVVEVHVVSVVVVHLFPLLIANAFKQYDRDRPVSF